MEGGVAAATRGRDPTTKPLPTVEGAILGGEPNGLSRLREYALLVVQQAVYIILAAVSIFGSIAFAGCLDVVMIVVEGTNNAHARLKSARVASNSVAVSTRGQAKSLQGGMGRIVSGPVVLLATLVLSSSRVSASVALPPSPPAAPPTPLHPGWENQAVQTTSSRRYPPVFEAVPGSNRPARGIVCSSGTCTDGLPHAATRVGVQVSRPRMVTNCSVCPPPRQSCPSIGCVSQPTANGRPGVGLTVATSPTSYQDASDLGAGDHFAYAVAMADFNGDGHLDVVVGSKDLTSFIMYGNLFSLLHLDFMTRRNV